MPKKVLPPSPTKIHKIFSLMFDADQKIVLIHSDIELRDMTDFTLGYALDFLQYNC